MIAQCMQKCISFCCVFALISYAYCVFTRNNSSSYFARCSVTNSIISFRMRSLFSRSCVNLRSQYSRSDCSALSHSRSRVMMRPYSTPMAAHSEKITQYGNVCLFGSSMPIVLVFWDYRFSASIGLLLFV